MDVTQLIKDYDNYIKKLCSDTIRNKCKFNPEIEYKDLYQECMLCLCNIVYNNKKPQFRYITQSLYRQVNRYIDKNIKKYDISYENMIERKK